MGNIERRKQVGIRDVAEALGISIGTVDRVLHGRGGVSPKTRDRVLKAIERLDYKPNLAARHLKLNRHIRIGVFLPEQIASFFEPMKAGIRVGAESRAAANVEVVLHSYPRLSDGDVAAMERYKWQQFDGIIVAPGTSKEFAAISRAANAAEKPVVYIATDAVRAHRLTSIAIESAVSGGIAAQLLGSIIRDRRCVVVVTGDLRIQDHAEKLRGFAASLATLSPQLALLPSIESHDSHEQAYQVMLSFLRTHEDLGGIYVATANSLPVLRALEESGKLGSVNVITTDLFPELSSMIESGHVFASIYQRPFTQGRLAFELLSDYLAKGSLPPPIVRLAPHIVLRSNLSLFANASWENNRSRM
jgi:LacI family transcriptional regulator